MDRLFTYWVVRKSNRLARLDSGASDLFQMDDIGCDGDGSDAATDLEAGGTHRITIDLCNINGLPTNIVRGRPSRTLARTQSEHR